MQLGILQIEGFIREVSEKPLKITFISCGQYGGRQGDELARLDHDVVAINTAKSDLDDLKIIERRIRLKGYDGAAKDINRGKEAIQNNKDVILEVFNSPLVTESDFVYVIAGMGGGTGNAAAPVLLNTLYNARIDKMFNDSKPTFGAIISVPGTWESRGMKKNAAWGLGKIQQLIDNDRCGSVIVIDNEKLINLSSNVFKETNDELDWRDNGNCSLASMFTEIISLTGIPSSKSFDPSELLDVISTPGYFALGKAIIDGTENANMNNITDKFKEGFANSPTASDYDYELDAVTAFMTVVQPKSNNPIVNEADFLKIEGDFGKFIANAEKPHTGIVEAREWGILTGSQKILKKESKAIIYTGVVLKEMPNRIVSMISEIEEEERELERKRDLRDDKKSANLSAYLNLDKAPKKEITKVNNELDLFGDPSSKLEQKKDIKLTLDIFE